MPLYSFRCPEGHEMEALVSRDTELRWCDCGKPAARQSVYRFAHSMGRTNSTEKLTNYSEAAAEMEYAHKRTDDPAVKEQNPPAIWHAAKVRAEAQMLSGARNWDKQKPQWSAKEID